MIVGLLCVDTLEVFSQYSVSGKIDNHGGRIVLLAATLSGAYDTLGNIVSADGKFHFEGKVECPVASEIHAINTKLRIPVFLENERFVVTANTKQPAIYNVTGGGEMQRQRNEFQKEELRLLHWRDSIRIAYEMEYGKGDLFGNLQIRGLFEEYENLYSKAEDEFIRKHDNLVSANLIAMRCKKLSRDKTLSKKYALLGEEARSSIQGKWLKPYAEKIARIVQGGIAPDLVMQTPEGDTLSIYGIKAKVKILDFWASWCGPCRAENPNVRRIYETYKEKGLEIVSISLDAKTEAWRKAIKDDQLPWIHISDLKGWNSIVTDVYGIHAIPYLFVLDEDNRIIAEGIRGEKLEKCVLKALGMEK